MAKFYGAIGYAETKETKPGVWRDVVTEYEYKGDILQSNQRFENGDGLNDDLVVNNRISIVADPFALENFTLIRYVTWLGVKWKVTSVEVQVPRLILTIGRVYNEQK